MAAKKQTKSKTRTTTKKQGFQFKWWMAAGLVIVVALVGVLVLRFSNASGYQSYLAKTTGNAFGAIRLEKIGNGEVIIVKPLYDGRYQQYTGNPAQATLTCLRPLGSYKNSGPPEQVGATNNFQEEPCV